MNRRQAHEKHERALKAENGRHYRRGISSSDRASNKSVNPIGVAAANPILFYPQNSPRLEGRSSSYSLTATLEEEQVHMQSPSLDDSFHSSLSTSPSSTSSISTTTTSTSVSLSLNPNSSLDNADLTGIALLKEIFPNESTQTLRELHYQHIIINKARSSVQDGHQVSCARDADEGDLVEDPNFVANAGGTEDETNESDAIETVNQPLDAMIGRSTGIAGVRASPRKLFTDMPQVELPEDFLRLPKSVAVLRRNDAVASTQGAVTEGVENKTNRYDDQCRYVFVSDMEEQAMQEYNLALEGNRTQNDREHHVEYLTIVVDKDPRWGLGMTLQEEEDEKMKNRKWQRKQSQPSIDRSPTVQHRLAIPYGLQVVGFLPDPEKIKRGEIVSSIARSPAEEAGIQLNDVLIGINGSAFLLPPASAISQHNELYKFQKENIIHSIQQSPDPVVLHIRRCHRPNQSSPQEPPELPIVASPTGRSSSLLDNTFLGEVEGETSFSEEHVNFGSSLVTPQRPRDAAQTVPPASIGLTPTPPQSQPLIFSSSLAMHPLSKALTQRKLIRSVDDQLRITRRLQHFTERTRQWESSNSLRISLGSSSDGLVPRFDPNDLPPDMAALMTFSSSEDDCDDHQNSNNGPADDTSQGLGNEQNSELEIESKSHLRPSFTPSTPLLSYDSPLIPLEYLQAFYGDEQARRIASWREYGANEGPDREKWNTFFSSYSGSSLQRLRQPRQISGSSKISNGTFSSQNNHSLMTWIPLHGIRKSLSARIVNCFVEEGVPNANDQSKKTASRVAYTIWVYDVESGREWYAPIRYWKDFCDLRDAAMTLLPPTSNLHKEISSLKIPKEPTIPNSSIGWSAAVFGSRVSSLSPLQERRRQRQNDDFEEARNETCRILEEFLRELLGIIYTCVPLHPVVAEVALYVQSFLGVEAGLENAASIVIDNRGSMAIVEREQERTRQFLKRSIQRYTWRVFLLHTMKAIIGDFVDAARARGPKLQDIESLEAQGRASLKARALEDLETIQAFLDHLVDLVLDGCSDDLRSIADRREYSPIRKLLADATYWDRLVRESVREQVEIEVYVPLRSVVSRLLVNGWRHEDMEVQFKIKELRKRPQGMFRIPEDKISPSHWQSVARILKQGVGMSTLPCVKLRAIVDAAREISRLHEREHGQTALLGADEFLPIFIFCVVRAEMDRPCALCVLLRSLCDRINRIGEIGYFLASFEAAIAHIQEIDLTEDREEMLSFLTVPLTEVSLND